MRKTMREVALDRVQLLPSMFKDRYDLNRAYLMSLKNQNLLQNYYLEAGLWMSAERPEDLLWGWESPTCELRGHFLGHWLSAAAHAYRCSGDQELKAKADAVVSELARCQRENGGLWAGPIPEKYLDWLARGKKVWAPHYTLHKTLMGLVDMYRLAGNEQALAVLINFAEWFHRWSGQFNREEFDNILDVETGGMLEVWADLYQITGDERHLQLLNRYDRPRFFEPLLAGKDVLTNMHANTTIPEVLGAARAWEVTGEERWFNIVEAYWDQAVRKRGFFCTGSQTSGEVWTPPFRFADRLSDTNQEHCVVYNMIRLANSYSDGPGKPNTLTTLSEISITVSWPSSTRRRAWWLISCPWNLGRRRSGVLPRTISGAATVPWSRPRPVITASFTTNMTTACLSPSTFPPASGGRKTAHQ